MKLRRILVTMIVMVLFAILISVPNKVSAAVATTPKYLGITELRSSGTGYAIGNPGANGITPTAAKLWNIIEYASSTSESVIATENMYCLRAGVGFTEGITSRATYNVFYDMYTEREAIKAQNTILQDLVEAIVEGGSRYDSVLALLDLMYLKGESTVADKEELLSNAGINKEAYTYDLLDDDIAAIQQAALWFFTNSDESIYDKRGNTDWFNYTLNGSTYSPLSGYKLHDTYEGAMRDEQAQRLYNYLISTAITNRDNYSNGNVLNVPATVNTTVLNYTESGSNYIVGPINITEATGNTKPYTIDFIVKNAGNATTGYTLLNKDQNAVSAGTEVKDLVGDNFYISIPKSSVETLSINININYSKTSATLWASSTNNQEQPIVIPEKENISVPVELTVTPNEDPFDLALRKYITKVNGVTLSGVTSRVPVIDETTLASGTTATYKHKKDPVVVKTGDIVTYKLTIYNEGLKTGRATKVVDQLPTGLKFTNIVSGNFELDSYNETTNVLNLKRKAANIDNLDAYVSGKLDSETIEIECEVIAVSDDTNRKVLTNVAWIEEAYNEVDKVTITNQTGEDRDSEPSTRPNVNKDNMSNYTGNGNKSDLTDSNYYYKGQQDDDDFEKLVILPEAFDLKLIKHITQVNSQNVPNRIISVDVSKLNTLDSEGNMITTGDYNLNKEPVAVAKGDIVTYTFRIYNEGMRDGYAKKITEDVPEGLEFIWSEKTGAELNSDTTLTDEEKEAIKFNQDYLWGDFVYSDDGEKIVEVSTDFLSKEQETTVGGNLIKGFGQNDGTKTEADISYKKVSIKFKVVSDNVTGEVIRNEAAITDDSDKDGNEVNDRDSSTDEWVKYEDDEDFDNIVLKSFDLALRKFIVAVSQDDTIETNEYLRNSDGSFIRAPIVDTSKLNTVGEDGKAITTAIYNHTKEPVSVKRNDYVVYYLRVYNEGDIDGYASEIKDHLPPYLEFVNNEFNKNYGWEVSGDGRTVTTRHLENELITRAIKNMEGEYVLSYKEVPIMARVVDTAKTGENITNIADITEYLDKDKNEINDRDSEKDNVKLPDDKDLPNYKEDETGSYVPGQQDDDDFEKVIVKKFDLALRKFITKVNDKNVDTRYPNISYENGEIKYTHPKDPVRVVTGDLVTYTIRVYNEGEINGFANLVSDDLPDGLEFIPENDVNREMRWVMFDSEGEETQDVSKAVRITTDYLSKEQGEERMDKENLTSNPNLLKAFDSSKGITEGNPDYKDLKIIFKIVEPNTSDKILVNSAQITDDSDEDGNEVEDEDSIPNEWNEGEDDQDKEYVELQYFDLALRKWVTQAIIIEDGKETIINTGHDAWDDPEPAVKVEIHKNKLNKVTVKFRYSIRIYNQGDIEGYANEITDYIPEGLRFDPSDNPGWVQGEGNKVTTRLLENTLLRPGESAEVEILLTWINNADNMGLKTNTAEISEDENEFGVPDIDSTPDNQVPGEDDIDDAPVILSIKTGAMQTYFMLGTIILVTLAGGVLLIKKYVL